MAWNENGYEALSGLDTSAGSGGMNKDFLIICPVKITKAQLPPEIRGAPHHAESPLTAAMVMAMVTMVRA